MKSPGHWQDFGKYLACLFFLTAMSPLLLFLDGYHRVSRLTPASSVSFPDMLPQPPPRLTWPNTPMPVLPKGSQIHKPLLILLWGWPFLSAEECSPGLGRPDQCRLTTNRSQYAAADAVLMYHRDVSGSPLLLPRAPRPPSQLWIWFNMDPPSSSRNLASMDGLFNLTMTYRRDSDIFTPYGWLRVLKNPQRFTIPPKSKLVALVSSKWPLGSRQGKYYRQIQRYFPVDVYRLPQTGLSSRELQLTLSHYKFYLAFENSVHEDYITEKLWKNALLAGAVPVVLGPPRENYERYLPPEAFVHVDDFPTVRELARFLGKLARDPVRYQRYFQWRTWLEPVLETSWTARLCRACRVLRETSDTFRATPRLSQWFK
uniref:Fucosyltransferase n=1 Tax=Pogona vitticeps TaxID=103695 RepID=A0A6J0ST80_9SAUR